MMMMSIVISVLLWIWLPSIYSAVKMLNVSAGSYYIDGRTARLEDLISRVVLDSLRDQLSELQDTIAAARSSDRPVWLGETSSCWGGGAPGLSDRYVAGFM